MCEHHLKAEEEEAIDFHEKSLRSTSRSGAGRRISHGSTTVNTTANGDEGEGPRVGDAKKLEDGFGFHQASTLPSQNCRDLS